MFSYIIFCLVVVGGLYGLYRWWTARIDGELAEGAAFEYDRLKSAEPEFLNDLSAADFAKIYTKAERPRAPGYWLAVVSTFLIGSPLMMGLLAGGDWAMHRFGIIPNPSEVVASLMLDDSGQTRVVNDIPPEALQYYVHDLGGFYYFFGLLIFWIGVVWFFMRRYHQRRPGLLRDEIIRAR
ncbi:MAG: hypothetical protein MRY59_12360 [Aquisalinus sp.]|nr:hypothetical protein [Aquisalinus sp.]